MSKSLKSSRMRCVRPGKIDSTSTLGTVKAKIAEQLGPVLSVFAVIASKITSSIMLRKEKYTAAHLSAHAKCSTMFQFVIA
jgi:ABC-type molybdenum transport system ATPase subunit/photorepair protein PhrA